MNGVRMLRSRPERLRQPFVVEGVDGVACGLRVAAQLVSYLVGVLAPVAGEKDLAERRKVKASGERKPASRDSRSASLSGRTKIGCFMLWRITLNYHPVWEYIRKAKASTLQALFEAAAQALEEVSAADARVYFEHCGYGSSQDHPL
jgi:hypothetical protein